MIEDYRDLEPTPEHGNDFIADVSSSKLFCTTDLLNAYQAGAVEMYNKIVNSIEKQTLKGLKEDSQEWIKLYISRL